MSPKSFSMLRLVPPTGVIWVMHQATQAGYNSDKPDWVNFGQGAPETGSLPDAPARIQSITIPGDGCHEYGPVAGIQELRQAVADLYNARYRGGDKKPYRAENVAISGGGRIALTRLYAILGNVHVGHVLPDYTAYEEGMGTFGTFSPTALIGGHREHRFDAARFRQEVLERDLSALLLSNPSNPTGKLLSGEHLRGWVEQARDLDCLFVPDEFYAHYVYEGPGPTVSAAEFVDDPDKDPVVVIDGITKNWRYPGWRISWTLGPREVIKRLISAGSFIDGGAAHPLQLAVLPLLNPELANAEARAIQAVFREKRDVMVDGLRRLGVRLERPKGSFYCWGDISVLPDGWNTGMGFFEKALESRVITVPGKFFDVDPGHRRPNRPGRLEDWIRFSFGPPIEKLRQGLEQLERAMHPAE